MIILIPQQLQFMRDNACRIRNAPKFKEIPTDYSVSNSLNLEV
ncbi:Putative uncharacterized protein [Lactococcus lactis subsp. lactis A12]|uniref:Uncharacterized protein n=1 Tax=Lactococcus lactis subsp. lactis A12 TaxID=1137134 RepID=S6FHX4_LACLL|nr:Putative uncharacterized protein [Lactococcus lactis subsp. lactis A12]